MLRRFGLTFWLVNALIFLDEVVYVALVPLLPLYARRFHLTVADVGLLYGAYPLLAFVSSVPAGALVDRLGPRGLLASGLALFVAASVGFAAAGSIELLLLARGLQGFAAGITAPAGLAAITLAVPAERRGETLGVTTGLQALSGFAGPLLGAIGATAIGLGPIYSIPAAFGALLLIGVMRMSPGELSRETVAPAVTFRERTANRDVRASVLFILAIGIGGGTVQTLAPLQLESGGLTASGVAALFAVSALIALALAPQTGRVADRSGVRAATAVWTALSVGLLLGFAVAHAVWLVSVLVVTFLPQIRSGGTLSYTLGASRADLGSRLGASFGLAIAAWSIGASAGPIASGYVAQITSRSVAYGLAGVLTALLLIPAIMPARRAACGSAGNETG